MTALPAYVAYGLTPLPLDLTNTAPVHIINRKIPVPDNKIGELKIGESLTFLVGHNTGVFRTLNELHENDEIPFKDKIYKIVKVETKPKTEISMRALLTPDPQKVSLRLMTCAGPYDPIEGDYLARLIIYAEEVQ
jgi:sortase (surface protein transpeptidase)